jgi:putative superfamily III holin-X
MHVETERPPLTHLFRDLSEDVRRLVRQEVELAKAELGEKVARYGKRAASLATAGGLLFFASLALLAAFMYGLTALLDTFLPLGVAVWLAPLLVAAVLGGIGYGLLSSALDGFKSERQAKSLTADSLQENREWLKSKM